MHRSRRFGPRSLKVRLAIWVILPAMLVIAIDFFVAYRGSEQIATALQQQMLHGAAAMISEQITFDDGDYEISIPPAAFDLLKNRSRDRVWYAIYESDGQLIAGDDRLPPFRDEIGQDGEAFFLTSLAGETARVIAYSYVIPNAPNGETVITQVAQTLRNHDAFRDDLLHSTIHRHFLLIVVIAALLTAAFRWMFKPIVEFSESLAARHPGSLERFDEKAAPTELEPVIHAMNDYVGRLDRTLSSYEKFVANTAHHLRNAFAVISAQINFAKRSAATDPVQQEVLGAAQKTLAQCTRVINQLLMLASLDRTKTAVASAGRIAVADVATRVIEELAPLAMPKGIELGVGTLDAKATVKMPARLVHELLTNLVGNAIEHMNQKGHVTVAVVTEKGEAVLSVIDDGVGIPAAFHDKVFERFFRIDEANPHGSGLGLAIVKEICDSAGGTVALSTPPGGTGLRVEVRLPLAPD